MTIPIQEIAQPRNIKPSRILAFDLARGLAIMFMIVIHVLNFYGSQEVQQGLFGTVIKFIFGWPSASVFVFIMGTFVAYSDNQNLSLGLKRAAMLFALGYLLNLMRATIPTWLSLKMGLVTYEQLGPHTPINGLLVVDILQCAALAFAICILLKYFFPNPKVWLVTAMVVTFGSPLLWDISSGIAPLDQVLKIFWGNKYQGSLFPLFPWLAYPLVGMAFGQWIKQCDDINKAFQRTLLTGVLVVAIGAIITLSNTAFHAADNMRSGPGIIVTMTGVVLIWLWLCQLIINKLKPNSTLKLLFFWSKNVTGIYVIHFLCIGWGLMIFGAQQLDLFGTILMMLGVGIISNFVIQAWLRITHTPLINSNRLIEKQSAA
ncbi:heparan-alpha-glucosaminide N-acetyltransferase domain-containing protein [Aliikangiella sp. IMCC44359]|uniref:heparan-alpha-glucosaminide N-acetyltransferase domain-containing protein n=1 Tax=Aliikangiella sp. IMCC44359 TaxID=3459125 RepID=UPI00403A9C8A